MFGSVAFPSSVPHGVKRSDALARIGLNGGSGPGLLRRLLGAVDDSVEDALERLLGERFDDRLARVPLTLGSTGVDPFGLDPQWAKYALVTIAMLHRKYFRADVFGIGNVPRGRVLLVANHAGQIPIDGLLIGAAMFMDAEPPRIIRAMVEKWAVGLPFVSLAFTGRGPPCISRGSARHREDLQSAL
jgi:hypothetical protein